MSEQGQSYSTGDAVTWTVGMQSAATRFANGQAVTGIDIPVKLSTGEDLTVFVPSSVYAQGVDAVKTAIQAEVDQRVAVARLTGTANGG